EDRHEVAEQERSDRGLRERVHAIDHAASGEEGAKYGQRERRDDESEIPGAQEAAFLLDHHRMQVRGRREPRHDRGVLDRIPRPVATQAEHRVAPPGPGDDPDPEERPGQRREASRRDEPTIASLPEGAAQEPMTEERDGVSRAWVSAPDRIVKSWVASANIIDSAATTTRPKPTPAAIRAETRARASRRHAAYSAAPVPQSARNSAA